MQVIQRLKLTFMDLICWLTPRRWLGSSGPVTVLDSWLRTVKTLVFPSFFFHISHIRPFLCCLSSAWLDRSSGCTWNNWTRIHLIREWEQRTAAMLVGFHRGSCSLLYESRGNICEQEEDQTHFTSEDDLNSSTFSASQEHCSKVWTCVANSMGQTRSATSSYLAASAKARFQNE